ncbi:MAG: corrinoid protein [candidate division KSB1 bacterium]|nr:corrinoid protein [candidate division KSB1 bacterium]MDQ7063910.1 corrinoid protein [candidate division KSB1 bacterium]
MHKELLQQLAQAVIDGNKDQAETLTNQLLDAGLEAKAILDNGLMPGMDVVGQRFRDNLIFVPEVLIAARAMKASLAILEPLLAASNAPQVGTVVIGTVKGDIHDIGKNIVIMMLRGAGFRVVDLGIDTPAEKFLQAAREENADIVGMSALLTTTMGYMKTVIERLKAEGLRVKTMVGGAPISPAFAEQIGADGYAKNAAEAVDKAKALLGV